MSPTKEPKKVEKMEEYAVWKRGEGYAVGREGNELVRV